MTNFPVEQDMPIVIGDNLACLTALHKLSSLGINVLHLSEGKKLGGHFAGLETSEGIFDIGMVLLELNFEGKKPLEELDQSNFTGWTESFSYTNLWISNTLDVQRIESPKIYVKGQLRPDYLIADQLDCFSDFKEMSLNISNKLGALHPRNKHTSDIYEAISFQNATIATLGQEFYYQFMYPWMQKLLLKNVDIPFLAKHHRIVWLPLYYPETISDYLGQLKINGIKEYHFHRPKLGTVANWVRRLSKDIDDSGFVLKHQCCFKSEKAGLKNIIEGQNVSNILFGCEPTKFSKAFLDEEKELGKAVSVSLQIIFGKVDVVSKEPVRPCVINILDPAVKGYRLTVQKIESINAVCYRVHFSLEISISEEENSQIMTDEEFKSNIENVIIGQYGKTISNLQMQHKITAMNALELPTRVRVRDTDLLASLITSYAGRNGLSLSGNLLGYARSSMNDQISQGLYFANKVMNSIKK